MKKILTKALSLVICIGFTGLQMSLATVLTTGGYANTQVLNGTGAVIKGHTAGLRAVETDLKDAVLRFDKHTRIDWSSLNVDHGQSIYFNNGSYGVLNNVVGSSISKIAGLIKSDSGKIIISNPNGMLFNGGKFEGGSLLLTTKSLTNSTYGDGYNYNELTVPGANNGTTDYAVVAIIGNSEISSPDISIVSNGVYIDNSTLASPNAGGVVLVTADGANFEAGKQINMGGDLSYKLKSSTKDQNNLYVANSAISKNDGTIIFTSGEGVSVTDSTLNGDVNISTSKENNVVSLAGATVNGDADVLSDIIYIESSANGGNTINGNLKATDNIYNSSQQPGIRITDANVSGTMEANSKNVVRITSTNAGDSTITGHTMYLTDVNLGKTTADATNGALLVAGNSTFSDDATLSSSARLVFGSLNNTGMPNPDQNITVNGKLTATAGNTLVSSANVTADSMELNATKGSVVQASTQGSFTADSMVINADTGSVIALDSTKPAAGYSAYTNAYIKGHTADLSSKSAAKLNAKSSTLNADITVADDAIITTNAQTFNGTVNGGDVNITATKNGAVANVKGSADDLTVTSETGTVHLTDITTTGDVAATADIIFIDTENNATNTIGGKLTATDDTYNQSQQPGVRVSDTNIAGTMDVSSKNVVRITNVEAGDSNITGHTMYLTDVDLGKTNATATNGALLVAGNSTFSDDATLSSAARLVFGSLNNTGNLNPNQSVKVNGKLTATAGNTLVSSADVTANSMDLTATSGSIVQASTQGSFKADTINVKAAGGSVVALSSEAPASGYSDYTKAYISGYTAGNDNATAARFNAKSSTLNSDITVGKEAKIITDAQTFNGKVTGGDIEITASKAGATANVTGTANDLTVVANTVDGTVNLTDITTTGDVEAVADIVKISKNTQAANTIGGKLTVTDNIANPSKATGANITDTNVAGAMDVSSKDVVRITNVDAGDSTISGHTVYLTDVDLGKTNATATNGALLVAGNSTFSDDATLSSAARLVFGSLNNTGNLNPNQSVSVNGTLKATAGNTIVSSADVTADAMELTATTGSVVQASTQGSLKADSMTIKADGGEIVRLDSSAPAVGYSDYTDAYINGYSYGKNSTAMEVSTKTANADLDLNVGANLVKIHSTAKHTDAEGISGVKTNQVEIAADGSAKVHDFNVTKKANDTTDSTGNLIVTTGKKATVEKVTADTDIRITTADDIVADNLKADNENNGVGDIYINGKNTTLTNSSAANVTEIATGKAKADTVTSTNGDVKIASTTADVDADNITSNNGDVVLKAETTVAADVINAVKGNVGIEAKGNISATDVVASRDLTNDDNSIGNITINSTNGGRVALDTMTADTNITVVTTGDVIANKLVADANQENGVGDIIINGKDTTLTNSSAAEVVEVATGKAIATNVTSNNGRVAIQAEKTAEATNITSNNGDAIVIAKQKTTANTVTSNNGDVKISSTGADVDADNITSNNGNVVIKAETFATADVVKADKGNVGIEAKGNIVANGVTAARDLTNDDNSIGNITIHSTNGGEVTLDTLTADTHITVVTAGDVKANKLIADANKENGVGDIIINGKDTTLTNSSATNVTEVATGKAIATNVTSNHGNVSIGANETATATDVTANSGNVVIVAKDKASATRVTAIKGDDDTTGNIQVQSVNADIDLDTLTASTNVEGYAYNGTVNVLGSLKADWDIVNDTQQENTVGDVILSGKVLSGENFSDTANSTVEIIGANVKLTQSDYTPTLKLQNVTAVAVGNDEAGDVLINIPTSNVVLNNINATRDIVVDNGNYDLETANLNKVHADSEWNGIGDLKLTTTKDINATDIAGANIELTSSTGNIKVDGAKAHKADQGDDKGNITITANNADAVVELGNIEAETNIIANANNGTIKVVDNLSADYLNNTATGDFANVENGVGDVILNAKKLDGKNFTTTTSDVAIKGANVKMTQTGAQDELILSNVTAIGLDDNNGDITYAVQDSKSVNMANINATHDINVHNDVATANTAPKTVITFDETITLNDVHADSEMNGRGDINLKAKGLVKGDNVSGANVILESTEGDVELTNATAARAADETTTAAQYSVNPTGANKSGNIVVTANNGTVKIGDLNAGSDIVGTSENGTINVIGALTADAENNINELVDLNSNSIGDVILSAKTLAGDNFTPAGSATTIQGANVKLYQTETPADKTIALNNIYAISENDNAGDVIVAIQGTDTVDISNIHATRDIDVHNDVATAKANPKSVTTFDNTITLKDVYADAEEDAQGNIVGNGVGDLNLRSKGDINAEDISGANITLESTEGDVVVSDATAHRGDQPDTDAGNIKLISDKGDVTLGNIYADTDILGSALNGNITQTGELAADTDKNGLGEVKLISKNGMDLGGDKGAISGADIWIEVTTEGDVVASNLTADGQGRDDHGNITIITPKGDVTIGTNDATTGAVNGTGDVFIKTDDGKAEVVNTHADSEGNGIGTLTIIAPDSVVATNDSGANIVIETNGDVTATDLDATGSDENGQADNGNIDITAGGDVNGTGIDANHDIEITAGGKVTLDDVHADAEKDADGNIIGDGYGDLIVHAGDDITINDGSGSNIGIKTDNGDVDLTDTHATGVDTNGDGNLIIVAPNGDVTLTDTDATNNVVVNVTTGDVNVITTTDPVSPKYPADSDNNTIGEFIVIRDSNINPTPSNPTIPQDAEKLLNELLQEGINTQSGLQTPIAFAADDDDESEILKRIVKTVFKTPETGIVTITDRFKSMK